MEYQKDVHPRLGFAGLGWIGLKRLQLLSSYGWKGDLFFFDPDEQVSAKVTSTFPKAISEKSFESLLDQDLDGVVIATPSAIHALQTETALNRGCHVFCQKPLGRNLRETERLVFLAQEKNLLLAVDYSYRHTQGIQQIKNLLHNNKIGDVYAVEAVFHNAYGPDKDWYYDKNLSGGGCLMDLGTHMADMLIYLLDVEDISVAFCNLLAKGRQIDSDDDVEDFAEAQLRSSEGISIRMACSWKHSVGKDAAIYLRIYGTKGGLEFQNVNGSFYEFKSDLYYQNKSQLLSSGPDQWEGRALCHWVDGIKQGRGFDDDSFELMKAARIIDSIYNEVTV
jgi:predicted dehydrogenase